MIELEATTKFNTWQVKRQPPQTASEEVQNTRPLSTIVFSAHGDTCFGESSCRVVPGSGGGLYFGEVDNFAGVHAMMQAYFSGTLPTTRVQCQVTHGEEKATNGVYYAGAREVMATLSPRDYVVVIDVTGHSSRHVDEASVLSSPHVKGHVVFEKVRGNQITRKLLKSLSGVHTHHNGIPIIQNSPLSPPNVPYTFETFDWCADAIAFEDETDAYRETQENTVFLGLQTCGGSVQQLSSSGDYNAGEVFCWKRDIEAVSLAIVDLANSFVQSYEALLEEGDHDSDK
mmetsp:Transcript_12745/g.20749  ORF Transcript_12745/g.20749 Transcript_12745/m.20749 type:complete len:286 (+) Transcript_12745:55-912(+)